MISRLSSVAVAYEQKVRRINGMQRKLFFAGIGVLVWLVAVGVGWGQTGTVEELDQSVPAVGKDAESEEDSSPVMSPDQVAVSDKKKDAVEEAYDEMEVLTEVMLQIRRNYVDEKTYQEIIRGALHGMLQELDEHSDFLDPDGYQNLQEETAGKFSGIGIHIGMRDGQMTVIAPIEDSPAYRAGLQAGDRIIQVGEEKTANMAMNDAIKKIRGPKGTPVKLTLGKVADGRIVTVEIVRDDIAMASVKGARLLQDKIGYMRITQFAEPTAEAVQASMDQLLDQGLDALILDLRSNPGGLLKSAVEVAEKFLPKGVVIVSTEGRKGVHKPEVKRSEGESHHTEFPMVVLVDGGSASASEIVAGALQDHKRAIIVGERTFGKGSVQSVLGLVSDKDSAIRLTIAHYLTPAGRMIHHKGIDPDISIVVTPEDWRDVQIRRAHLENPGMFAAKDIEEYKEVEDRVLQRSLDLLQGLLVFEREKAPKPQGKDAKAVEAPVEK